MALRLFSRWTGGQNEAAWSTNPGGGSRARHDAGGTGDLPEDPLLRHMELGQYGLIVGNADQWRDHADIETIFKAAAGKIDDSFALVPEGYASVPQSLNDTPGCPEVDVETRPFLLARHVVTNLQYQRFVDSGGYENLDLWPKDIWPHLIDLNDQTDRPGPRYWRDGRHEKQSGDHPVVGICYYEAEAYAKWAGYRLPTEAEWQMAASWRIRSSAHVLRRYPWGDALDTRKCNIWASGVGGTAPVTAYEGGASPNGVLQLIGNVWEWTGSDFVVSDDKGKPMVGDMLMKVIRGGAFDTYFPCQATSFFRTGLASLSRVQNVGVRCAMDLGRNSS
jgi:gamma-glutamyl hercynylcysteine S-oxide synthase